MTVAANDTIERYVITGAGPYAYTWRIFNDTDLQVYALSTDSPPTPSQLTYLTHYTVSGANLSAGTITLTAAALALFTGFTLDIRSNTPRNQPTSIRNLARFSPEIHEDAYDYLERQIQDLGRHVDASVQTPDNEPALAMILPPVASRAGKFGVYDALGLPTVASGTGNDSALRTDLAVTTAGIDGSRLIGYRRTEAGSIAKSLFTKFAERVSVADFGTNTVPGTTDMTAAIQAAVTAAAALGAPAYLPASMGECKITSPILITAGRSGLIGDGMGKSRILCSGCNGFTVSPGLSFITLAGFSLATTVRYTTTPNVLTGVDIQGTTASQVYQVRIDDLFIDGFQVSIAAYGVAQFAGTRIDTEFCLRGFVAEQLTQNSFLDDCFFVGKIGTSDRGIVIGDGSSAAEGWSITNCLSYGFNRAVWVRGTSTIKVSHCILDFFGEFGVLISSGGTNAAFDVSVTDNYIAATGTADTGIYLANSVAPSTPHGNLIANNRILVYGGSTLTNGILCDGTQESNNIIAGNRIRATTFDCKIAAGAGHLVYGNKWLNTGFSATVQVTYNANVGTNNTVNFTSGYTIDGSAVYDPPNLADGAGTTTTIAFSGAALGDFVLVSFSLDLQGITVTGYVSAANVVSIRFQNESGGALDLASGTLRTRVIKL